MSLHVDDDNQQPGSSQWHESSQVAPSFPARNSNLCLEALVAMTKIAHDENSCVTHLLVFDATTSEWYQYSLCVGANI